MHNSGPLLASSMLFLKDVLESGLLSQQPQQADSGRGRGMCSWL